MSHDHVEQTPNRTRRGSSTKVRYDVLNNTGEKVRKETPEKITDENEQEISTKDPSQDQENDNGVEKKLLSENLRTERLKEEAEKLAKEVELEAKIRANKALEKKILELSKARDKANAMSPVVNRDILEGEPETRALLDTLDLLETEAAERDKQQHSQFRQSNAKHMATFEHSLAIQRAQEDAFRFQQELIQQRRESQARWEQIQVLQADLDSQRKAYEQHSMEQRSVFEQKMREMQAEQSQLNEELRSQMARERKDAQDNLQRMLNEVKNSMKGPSGVDTQKHITNSRQEFISKHGDIEQLDPDLDLETVEKVLKWQKESGTKPKLGKEYIMAMTKDKNRAECPNTGVNRFKNLELIDPTQEHLLQLKTQEALRAAAMDIDLGDDDDGELCFKKKNLKSGLDAKANHKVRVEIEWAHNNLGREFEANPLSINQVKFEHYVTGEARLIALCDSEGERRARAKTLARLAYWRLKFDWPQVRNVYAAAMRDLETGRETWNTINIEAYKEMLEGFKLSKEDNEKPTKKKAKDAWFCAAYQKGECKIDANHWAKVGEEQRWVQHICASCWLKDNKKAMHPSSSTQCPKAKA